MNGFSPVRMVLLGSAMLMLRVSVQRLGGLYSGRPPGGYSDGLTPRSRRIRSITSLSRLKIRFVVSKSAGGVSRKLFNICWTLESDPACINTDEIRSTISFGVPAATAKAV